MSSKPEVTKQAKKHALGLAGEFLVAGELLRRGIRASVTYGNAKKADVVALSASGTKATVLEVKTTSAQKWIIGNSVPMPSDQPWVLVYLPPDNARAPEYYVMTSEDLHSILSPLDAAYRKSFLERRKHDFTGVGVVALSYAAAQPYRSQWSKITALLGETS